MFLHIFMKQHQALSHRTGEGNLHHTSPPDLGHQGLFGAVWVFSFLCQKTNPHRLSRAICHHVKPTQKLSGMRRSLLWVRYWWLKCPSNRHSHRQNSSHHYNPVSFSQRKPHCPGHRDMVSHCFLSATAGSWSADWKPNSTFFRKAWPCLNPQGDQW